MLQTNANANALYNLHIFLSNYFSNGQNFISKKEWIKQEASIFMDRQYIKFYEGTRNTES